MNEASEAAMALKPFAGDYASLLFAVSLANASILGAMIVPLATAYYICEAMGWEAGVNKSFKEAPQFMGIYTMMIAAGAVVVLVPNAPLVFLMVLSAVVNGLMLPFVLIYVIMLINNPKIMGEFVNSRVYNVISWATVVTVALLTVLFVFSTIFPVT